MPAAPLVSWNAPRPASPVGGWPTRASTGTREANDSASPATRFMAPPPEVAATTPKPVARAYPSAMVAAENSCLAITPVTGESYSAS
ncbi:Uncharacterised protein [Mycobacteroides abscessus subsp. abscessus]|nr:Uncharacterised protein [Mycobacteroides abscessus subsp. abscessus]